MKSILTLLFIAILIVSCKNDTPKTNADSTMKEVSEEMAEMKSYVIQYKQVMSAAELKSTSLMTQYIDLKNNKFAMETETSSDMMGVKSEEKSLTINDKDFTYIINLKDKTGMKLPTDEMEDDPTKMIKSDNDVTFREMIEKEGGKILPNEQFLGKDCIVVEFVQDSQTMKMWYYKGIPLKITSQFYTMEATKLEENASIPTSKFEIPEGIKFTEMPSVPSMH